MLIIFHLGFNLPLVGWGRAGGGSCSLSFGFLVLFVLTMVGFPALAQELDEDVYMALEVLEN